MWRCPVLIRRHPGITGLTLWWLSWGSQSVMGFVWVMWSMFWVTFYDHASIHLTMTWYKARHLAAWGGEWCTGLVYRPYWRQVHPSTCYSCHQLWTWHEQILPSSLGQPTWPFPTGTIRGLVVIKSVTFPERLSNYDHNLLALTDQWSTETIAWQALSVLEGWKGRTIWLYLEL